MSQNEGAAEADLALQSSLVDWAQNLLTAQGINVTGAPDVVKRRAWSMVLRLNAAEGDYFLKASPPTLAHEAALTHALANRHPDQIVEVVAIDEARGWLLMRDGGALLRDHFRMHADASIWLEVLGDYARLQIAEMGRVDTYLRMGLPDRRSTNLPEALERLLDEPGMVPLDVVDEFSTVQMDRLEQFLPLVREICGQLVKSPITASLDHGDFHDGNIFYNDGCLRIFDWGDSGVGHPFMSLRTTFVSVENTFGIEEEDPVFDDLRDAYLAPWSSVATEADLRKTFSLAQQIWAIPSALRWAAALRAGPPSEFKKYVFAVPSLLAELLGALENSRS